MPFELPFSIKLINPQSVDFYYLSGGTTPYSSVAQANSATAGVRYIGLTVNINGVEYWYKNGITDGDLILKTVESTGSGERIEKLFTQSGHGFIVGNAVAYSGGSFTLAIAETDFDGEVMGVVSEVDGDDFTVVFAGYVTGMTSYGFSPNTTYFLSDLVAGGYRTTPPSVTGTTVKPMLTTFGDADQILVFQYLEVAVTTGVTGGGGSGITDGVNVGIGEAVFKETSGDTMVFKTIEGTGGTNVFTVGDTVYVSGGTSSSSKNVQVWNMSDTVTDEDVIAFSGVTGTSYNVTLPASPTTGREVTIGDITGTADSSVITILGGTESIFDGTTVINTQYGSVGLIYTGFGWKITSFVN